MSEINKPIKTRYNDEELAEFKALILEKLERAESDYKLLKSTISHGDSNDTQDTSPTFKVLEEGAETLSREHNGRMAQRQLKFYFQFEPMLLLNEK